MRWMPCLFILFLFGLRESTRELLTVREESGQSGNCFLIWRYCWRRGVVIEGNNSSIRHTGQVWLKRPLFLRQNNWPIL
jgi:hypothetical protein